MDADRFERALHETEGLGNWRRDLAILAAVAAVVFVGLRLLAPGSMLGNLLYALLVGVGVLVVLPLFELASKYRKAPSGPLEGDVARMEESLRTLREDRPVGTQPVRSEPVDREHVRDEHEEKRYRSLRERLTLGRGGPREGPGPE